MGSRECYLNSLWKAEPQSVNVIIMDIEMFEAPEEGPTPKYGKDDEMSKAPKIEIPHDKLDPRIIETGM